MCPVSVQRITLHQGIRGGKSRISSEPSAGPAMAARPALCSLPRRQAAGQVGSDVPSSSSYCSVAAELSSAPGLPMDDTAAKLSDSLLPRQYSLYRGEQGVAI